MGTAIHCFFARGADQGMADLQTAIDGLMAEHREEIRHLRERGRFSQGEGSLHLALDRPGDGDPEYIWGEGPAGLMMDVYQRVIFLRSMERFRALFDESMGVALALRRILGSAARRLSAAPRIAVAAGGFGDTDRAVDLAYYEGAPFDGIVAMLEEVAGPPALTWDELARDQYRWYLGGVWTHS